MEILTFNLNQEIFGIFTHSVKEIIIRPDVITIPAFSPFIKQVIKVRGELYGIIHMENFLDLEEIDKKEAIIFREKDVEGCFMVTHTLKNINFNQSNITKEKNNNFLIGRCEEEGNVIRIIDLNKIVFSPEIKKLWFRNQ